MREAVRNAIVAALSALAVVCAAFLIANPVAAQTDDAVKIPVDCGNTFCVLPRAGLEAIFRNHNAAIAEIRRLKAELASGVRACPDDKGA